MNRLLMDRWSVKSSSWALGVAVLLLVFPVGWVEAQQSPAAVDAAAGGTVEEGKGGLTTYTCSSCHGYSGHGGVDVGAPRIATTSMSLSDFTQYVRQAGVSSMPRFNAEILPDTALADIYAFLKSIPPPPDSSSIPLLNDQ